MTCPSESPCLAYQATGGNPALPEALPPCFAHQAVGGNSDFAYQAVDNHNAVSVSQLASYVYVYGVLCIPNHVQQPTSA